MAALHRTVGRDAFAGRVVRAAGWLVAVVLVAPLGVASAQQPGLPTAAVQVTTNPAPVRAHSSPQLAVNPKTGELVIVESDVRGNRRCVVHLSQDQGRTWLVGGEMMMEPFDDCSFYAEYGPYATLTFARDGTLYVAFVASERLNRARNDTPRHVFVARSSDGGRTFQTSRVYRAPDGNPDRGLNKGPMVAVDPTNPSRVYVGWRQGVFQDAEEKLKSNVAVSSDGGRTFSPPVDITDERGGDYPGLAVDSRGVVHAVYWTRTFPPVPFDQPNPVRPIQYVRSADQGKTWSSPRVVDPGSRRAYRPPLLAADPQRQALYIVWYANAEADNQGPQYSGHLDIFFKASLDGGDTWPDRRILNDDRSTSPAPNHFEPGISVAPNGRIDVAWYDFRLSPVPPAGGSGEDERGAADVYYTSSTNQGRTFTRNLRVTDRSIDRSIGVWSNNIDSRFNVGIASTDTAVSFAWQDSRNGRPDTGSEDVYTAILRTSESKEGRASGALPGWALILLGLLLGMGVTMVSVAVFTRRRRVTAAA